MSTTTNIPVVVQPDAAAYVAELGRKKELESMIDHARHTVAGLRGIDVELWPPYDYGETDRVVILVTKDNPDLPDDPTGRQLGKWKVETFPPEVCEHFCFLVVYGADRAS